MESRSYSEIFSPFSERPTYTKSCERFVSRKIVVIVKKTPVNSVAKEKSILSPSFVERNARVKMGS